MRLRTLDTTVPSSNFFARSWSRTMRRRPRSRPRFEPSCHGAACRLTPVPHNGGMPCCTPQHSRRRSRNTTSSCQHVLDRLHRTVHTPPSFSLQSAPDRPRRSRERRECHVVSTSWLLLFMSRLAVLWRSRSRGSARSRAFTTSNKNRYGSPRSGGGPHRKLGVACATTQRERNAKPTTTPSSTPAPNAVATVRAGFSRIMSCEDSYWRPS
jgi:hypothetical protein